MNEIRIAFFIFFHALYHQTQISRMFMTNNHNVRTQCVETYVVLNGVSNNLHVQYTVILSSLITLGQNITLFPSNL